MTELKNQFEGTQPIALPNGVEEIETDVYKLPSGNRVIFSGRSAYLGDPNPGLEPSSIFGPASEKRNMRDVLQDVPAGYESTVFNLYLGEVSSTQLINGQPVIVSTKSFDKLNPAFGAGKDLPDILAVAAHRGLTNLPTLETARQQPSQAIAPIQP